MKNKYQKLKTEIEGGIDILVDGLGVLGELLKYLVM